MTEVLQDLHLDVPVRGGTLRVAKWGSGPRTVIGLHGLTASHVLFRPIVRRLGDDLTFLAPDMRGRGASASLPGPYGMVTHSEDVFAIIEHLGLDRVVLAGMSMGGYPALLTAVRHPERVDHVVLIDAGLPAPLPPGVDDVEALIANMLGPSMARLEMTFESRDAYLDFWRAHPSMADDWNDDFEAYIDYDLTGAEPELRTGVNPESILADSSDTYRSRDDFRAMLEQVRCPVTLLRATRGVLNEPQPLFPDDVVDQYRPLFADLRDEVIDDTNHFTIVFGERPASIVAARIREAAGL